MLDFFVLVYALRVKNLDAQKNIRSLKEEGLYDDSRKVVREDGFVFIPLKKRLPGCVEKELPLHSKKKGLKELFGIGSFDVVGNIVIVFIPDELWEKRSEIGAQAMKLYPGVSAVYARKGAVHGRYRLPNLELIAGSGSETTHKENGLVFKLDVTKTYFSARQASERLKLVDYVERGDRVAVLFAGIGPVPIYFSKFTEASEIFAVEMNPDACRYMEENVKLNKCGNIKVVCGNAHDFKGKFDLLVLPLPHGSPDFIDKARSLLNEGGRAIFYIASSKEGLEKKLGLFSKFEIEKVRKEIEIAPGEFRFVVHVRDTSVAV